MSNSTQFDWDRESRSGLPEVVFAEGKRVEQIAEIIIAATTRGQSLLITRLSDDAQRQLLSQLKSVPVDPVFDYDSLSQTAFVGLVPPCDDRTAVGIVCAGTSDLPVALEAQRSLQFFGRRSALYADVGVAGLWRLLDIVEPLRQHPVLIAVAGMEGALFSVLAGLVPGLVIAVPTSVGYGVARGGQAALSSALASCSPGIVCVNIDNGFGAAAATQKMQA